MIQLPLLRAPFGGPDTRPSMRWRLRQIVWEIVDANPGLEPMVDGFLDDEEEK